MAALKEDIQAKLAPLSQNPALLDRALDNLTEYFEILDSGSWPLPLDFNLRPAETGKILAAIYGFAGQPVAVGFLLVRHSGSGLAYHFPPPDKFAARILFRLYQKYVSNKFGPDGCETLNQLLKTLLWKNSYSLIDAHGQYLAGVFGGMCWGCLAEDERSLLAGWCGLPAVAAVCYLVSALIGDTVLMTELEPYINQMTRYVPVNLAIDDGGGTVHFTVLAG